MTSFHKFLSFLVFSCLFLFVSSFLPSFSHFHLKRLSKFQGRNPTTTQPLHSATSQTSLEGEKVEEHKEGEGDEIISPQIKLLQKKIEETKTLINNLTIETDKINNEIKQLDEQYGDQIETITQDFQRLKQRSYQESKEVTFRAKADAIKEVLPVTDAFLKYKQLYSKVQDPEEKKIAQAYEELFEGVEDIIHSFGAKRLTTLGTPFNVDNMDAIMTSPSTEYRANVVCAEFQYGYEIDGRCIRPAMVSVSEGPGPAQDVAVAAEGQTSN